MTHEEELSASEARAAALYKDLKKAEGAVLYNASGGISAHTYMHVHICTYMCVCVLGCLISYIRAPCCTTLAGAYAHTHTCMYIYVHIYVHMYTYVCTGVSHIVYKGAVLYNASGGISTHTHMHELDSCIYIYTYINA